MFRVIALDYWHWRHSMWDRVYETVRCIPAAAGLLLWARRTRDVDGLLHAGSATSSAYNRDLLRRELALELGFRSGLRVKVADTARCTLAFLQILACPAH